MRPSTSIPHNSSSRPYAFGSAVKERTASFTQKYRFGFNNQEQEIELGEYYSFEYRVHDARLGRFLSVDPWANKYYHQSTYVFAFSNPILKIDWKGLGEIPKPHVGDMKITDEGELYLYSGKKNGWVELNTALANATIDVIKQKRADLEKEYGSNRKRKIERKLSKMWDQLLLSGKELAENRKQERRIQTLEFLSHLKPIAEDFILQDLLSIQSRKKALQALKEFNAMYELPKWLKVAFEEMSKNPRRRSGPDSDPNIKKYFSSDPNQGTLNDDFAWCAAFVNYCLKSSGYKTPATNPYYTYNWYNGNGQPYRWEGGYEVNKNMPVYGGIVFFDWGHVGIIVGKVGNQILCLGGNQGSSSEINVTSVHMSNIDTIMLPNGYTAPLLFCSDHFLKTSYSGDIGPRGTTR